MWQELLITDVTQMAGTRVCIAGINHKGQNIRPNPRHGIIEVQHLIHPTFVMRPRAVVEMFLKPKLDNVAPHLEDHAWDMQSGVRFLRMTSKLNFRRALYYSASKSVEAIFETPILRNKNIQPGTGARSVGTIKARQVNAVEYRVLDRDQKKRYALSFIDPSGALFEDIPITDLALRRYFQSKLQQEKAADEVCEIIHERLSHANEVWLRLGLGREWNGWCWLQVNGIYSFPEYLRGRCFNDFQVTDTD